MKKYFTLLIVILALASCATPPATPNPAQVGMTMFADQVNADATQAKLESIFTVTAQVVGATQTQQAFWQEGTATQQARVDANSTAQQAQVFAQATSDQARRDIQATQSRIDADATQAQARIDAESTAEQARLDLIATQQAAGTSTAFVITQTAIPPANTMTAIAQGQSIALVNNQVQLSNLEVEQQRQKNTPEWVVPFLIAIVATAAGAMYLMRYSRAREFKDADGTVQLVVFDNNRVISPNLLPGPIVELKKEEISMPLLVAPAEQSKVTERAQAVEAIKHMPTSTSSNAAQTFNKYFGQPQENLPFDVIDAEDAPPAGLIDGQAMQSLNKDWKDAKDEK